MANEIRTQFNLAVTKGSFTHARTLNDQVTMSGTHASGGIQTIGTTYEQVVISGDVATLGWAYFVNNDLTNYVEIGVEVSSAFYPLLKLLPGEGVLVRLSNVGVFARANTASIPLEFEVLEA